MGFSFIAFVTIAHTEETLRLATYRRLLKKLPPDNRITLNALCGHFYM